MPADVQMNYSASGAHVQWFSCWKIIADDHEMMSQGSLMLLREGTIKEEHTQTSGLSSGYSDTELLGSIDKPQTPYSDYLGASCGAEHNQNELCVLFIHMHVPRPLWGTFSQYEFICLMLAW